MNNNNKNSNEEFVVNYLRKNKDILLRYPELLNLLKFPSSKKDFPKVIDLNTYRSNKIKEDYYKLQKQFTDVLKAGSSHIYSQKRILKTSLKIINAKSLQKVVDLIINDLGSLLGCDSVNCFFTNKKINHKGLSFIDNRVATSYFRDKPQTYLNQNPKGINVFFPNKVRIIKSYMLLKIVFGSDRFIVALGSKNKNKFTKDQKVDLIEYLIQVIQIKLTQV
tara:strand:- start:234 stop:896 length:663 start_codon:yes stop_codon:yes gene_type:complete